MVRLRATRTRTPTDTLRAAAAAATPARPAGPVTGVNDSINCTAIGCRHFDFRITYRRSPVRSKAVGSGFCAPKII